MLIENTIGVKTVYVIELSLGRVTENLVGLRNSLEEIFRLVITRIDIRVIPARKPSKGPLNFVQRCRPSHIEKDVKIFFTGHTEPAD